MGGYRRGSVLDSQKRLEQLEQRVLYLESRLQRRDWLESIQINRLRELVGDKGLEQLGISSSSCDPTASSCPIDSAPGPACSEAVRLEKPWTTLLTGISLS